MSTLPHGWTTINLFEICRPKQWKTISTKELLPAGYVVYGANGIIGYYDQFTHEKPTVMITCRGATCGNIHISVPFAYINGNAMALDELREEVCLLDYFKYYLRARGLEDTISGSAQPQITQEGLRKVDVVIAPINEQKRIADKLDAVLARVDACRDRLDRIPGILKRFRQSVLAAATSGKLTDDWRQTENEWAYLKAEDLCEWITKGTTPPKHSMYEGRGEIPYIKVYNLCFDGRLDFTINPTFVDKDTHEVLLKRSKVFPGDVLMNIVGPPLGKVSIIPNSYPEWNINQAVAVFRVKEKIYNRFLAYFLMCESTIDSLIRKSKATAGQFNLTLEICRQIEVPLPSIEEQTEIVRRVESLFAYADRLEARYNTARTQVEKLTPSLLAKAFRGELVPQDPNDEPASELLARIAAVRVANTAEKMTKPTIRKTVHRTPKENAITMSKSRQDDDVKNQPYLSEHLRKLGGAAAVESLFKASELPVADFYKQLAWEVAQGFVKDNKTVLEAADAA